MCGHYSLQAQPGTAVSAALMQKSMAYIRVNCPYTLGSMTADPSSINSMTRSAVRMGNRMLLRGHVGNFTSTGSPLHVHVDFARGASCVKLSITGIGGRFGLLGNKRTKGGPLPWRTQYTHNVSFFKCHIRVGISENLLPADDVDHRCTCSQPNVGLCGTFPDQPGFRREGKPLNLEGLQRVSQPLDQAGIGAQRL